MGPVVMQLMPGSVVMVLGDAVNLGFRISSIAGREGRPNILATEAVRQAALDQFIFGEPESVTVKGRVGIETIYGVSAPLDALCYSCFKTSAAPRRLRRWRAALLPNWPRTKTAPSKTKVPNTATLPSGAETLAVVINVANATKLFEPHRAMTFT